VFLTVNHFKIGDIAMVKVRVKFSADLVVEGSTLEEARSKWESLPLFTDEAKKCGVEYSETLLVEDAETCEDLMGEWY
jgi:hypothetical protein